MSNLSATTDYKTQLRQYFDGTGFERWAAIYGDDDVSVIRQTVRDGHAQMLNQAQAWLLEKRSSGTLFDAGCGTGLFSLAMAQEGFDVTAVDIAPRMVEAAQHAAEASGLDERITFQAGDIEQVDGQFDAVACFDVLVHYPAEGFRPLCESLAARSKETFLFTYAPYNRLLAALHWVGGHFPNAHRRTEIQMIRDHVVEDALHAAGMDINRTHSVHHGFYHVTLVEAIRR